MIKIQYAYIYIFVNEVNNIGCAVCVCVDLHIMYWVLTFYSLVVILFLSTGLDYDKLFEIKIRVVGWSG